MRRRVFLGISGGVLAGCGRPEERRAAEGPARPLPQGCYVWQRKWTAGVADAVRGAGTDFDLICYLAAEREGRNPPGQGEWRWVEPDWKALSSIGGKVAAALRVGVIQENLASLAAELRGAVRRVREAAAGQGVVLAEVHLDLDSPASRLGEYAVLLRELREEGDGLKWVITALPDWLGTAAFAELARAAGSYILQVHALRLPVAGESDGLLCDEGKARAWVKVAGRLGVPFRVALPTYASRVFFDAAGKVLDVAGEDGAAQGPAGTVRMCLMRSDAAALAGLVKDWRGRPPEGCTGLIWYRLPVAGDRWNWSRAALRQVMAGDVPAAAVELRTVRNEAGFYEVEATVNGGVEVRLPEAVAVSGPAGSAVTAWDSHGNWQGQLREGRLYLSHPGGWLFPGRILRPGWFRLSRPGAPVLTFPP